MSDIYKFSWSKAFITWLIGMGVISFLLMLPMSQNDITGGNVILGMGLFIVTFFVVILSFVGGFDEKIEEEVKL